MEVTPLGHLDMRRDQHWAQQWGIIAWGSNYVFTLINCERELIIPNDKKQTVTTLAGKYTSANVACLRDIRLPEFDKNRKIESHKALVFDTPCRYDMIIGSDFLHKLKMDIHYSK
jgi:hypothetical protein